MTYVHFYFKHFFETGDLKKSTFSAKTVRFTAFALFFWPGVKGERNFKIGAKTTQKVKVRDAPLKFSAVSIFKIVN